MLIRVEVHGDSHRWTMMSTFFALLYAIGDVRHFRWPPLLWMPVHAEPLRMRTNVVHFRVMRRLYTVANEIDYAWTSIHDNGQGVTASDVILQQRIVEWYVACSFRILLVVNACNPLSDSASSSGGSRGAQQARPPKIGSTVPPPPKWKSWIRPCSSVYVSRP